MTIVDSFSAKYPSMITVLILQLHSIKLSTDLALTAVAVPLTGDMCKSRFGSKFQHQLKPI